MSPNEINELKAYFKSVTLPNDIIQLDGCTKIFDLKLFLNSHFDTIYSYGMKQSSIPYLDRLLKLKEILQIRNKTLQENK